MGDTQAFDVFMAIQSGPVMTANIIKQTKMPQTTVYRKLRWLRANGFIKFDKKEILGGYEYHYRPIYSEINFSIIRNGTLINTKDA